MAVLIFEKLGSSRTGTGVELALRMFRNSGCLSCLWCFLAVDGMLRRFPT
jgi:hypothetical protein